jgi:site-specific recombinase XerD
MLAHYFKSARVQERLRRNLLADRFEDFVERLHNRGHPLSTIQVYTQSVEHFGYWLRNACIPVGKIDNRSLTAFLNEHLPVCQCPAPRPCYVITVRAALSHLFKVLYGSRHYEVDGNKNTLIDDAVSEFELYLDKTCGLAATTVKYRARYAREFLSAKFGRGALRFSNITPHDLMEFVADRAHKCKTSSVGVAACSLRSYLRFLQLRGECDSDLAGAVPRIANRKLSTIPKTITKGQLQRVLASFNRSTAVGKRDYAMALCQAELGLRASEVACLRLDSIDWRNATLKILSGKSRNPRVLPLLSRVGHAVASYLRHGRVETKTQMVFVRHATPRGTELSPELVRGAMRRAYARARLDAGLTGTHVLRHTAASIMHQRGASLKEIADVLGHQSIDTTAIYTKVNLPALAAVALPWPEVLL